MIVITSRHASALAVCRSRSLQSPVAGGPCFQRSCIRVLLAIPREGYQVRHDGSSRSRSTRVRDYEVPRNTNYTLPSLHSATVVERCGFMQQKNATQGREDDSFQCYC